MRRQVGFAAVAATLFALLTGCQTLRLAESAPRSSGPCLDQPGGWCDFTRTIAGQVWQYAQLATNSYEPSKEDFKPLPGVISRYKSKNDDVGFAYEIFDRREAGRLTEVIVAFRGTEDWADWWYGNVLGLQNERGLEIVRRVQADLDNTGHGDVPIIVTGHSLGGGIAHYVSLRELPAGPDGKTRTVAASYVFNNSPRYSRGPAHVPRIAVIERGEALQLLRAPAIEATQKYLSINCRPGFGPKRDHHMRYLAECLTWIAAFNPGNREALDSVNANQIARPPSQSNNDHPPGEP